MSAALHVRESGPVEGAPVVVLLHAGVADSRGWDAVTPTLVAHGCRVLAPDLRGWGASPDPTTDFRHADDVIALLDERGIREPVVVVGWSMSGTIALDVALDHPDRVAALALVCSVPEPLPRSEYVEQSWEREDALLEAGDIEGAIRNDVETWGAGPHRDVDVLDQALVAYLEDVGRDLHARSDASSGSALDGDRDAPSRIGDLACPLLAVHGLLDTPCHAEAAQVLARDARDVRVVEVEDAAHMAPMERPGEVAAALITLVERA